MYKIFRLKQKLNDLRCYTGAGTEILFSDFREFQTKYEIIRRKFTVFPIPHIAKLEKKNYLVDIFSPLFYDLQ